MLLHDLMLNFCHHGAMLETLALPAMLKMKDREHFEEVKKAESVSTMIHESCRVLKEELQANCCTLRSSNSRMVQLYMSKQMDAKGMLTNEQYELARTLMQWLRNTIVKCLIPKSNANKIVQLPTRESSPRKKQKMGVPSLFLGSSLVEGLKGLPAARTQNDGFDPVTDEIERWERLSQDSFFEFADAGALLNEFAMLWALRERFPLHFIVFKQTACHLSHEANVGQVFSRTGKPL
jgi:hypothetical protein